MQLVNIFVPLQELQCVVPSQTNMSLLLGPYNLNVEVKPELIAAQEYMHTEILIAGKITPLSYNLHV